MYLAYSLFRRVMPVLQDHIAIAPEELTATLSAISEVRQVRRVRTRWIGSARSADVIVAVNGSLSLEESHQIADKIEALLEKDFQIEDTMIHVEPETNLDWPTDVRLDSSNHRHRSSS